MTALQRRIFFSLLFLFTTSIFASDSFLPSLPAMTVDLHTSHRIARLTITIYLLGLGISPLILGPFSDRHGRRKIMLIGLMVAILGSLLCYLASDILWVIIGRFIQAAGASAAVSVSRAMSSDIFKGKELARMGSYLGISIGLVPAIAPTIGGYVQHAFGWRGNFALIGLLMVAAFFWVLFAVPETVDVKLAKPLKIKHVLKTYGQLLSNFYFIVFPILSAIGFAALMSYLAISPFLFQGVLDLTPVQYGWLAAAVGMGIIIGSLLNARLVKYCELRALLLIAGFIMLFASVLMLVLGMVGLLNVWVVILPIFIFVIGSRLIFSNVFSAGMASIMDAAGSATALFSSIQIIGAAVITSFAAAVHVTNQMPLAWILLFLTIIYLVLMLFVKTIPHHPDHDAQE